MPNTLERISISNFMSIRNLDLELTSLNVLIGANGSGKSNFIAVFRLLNEILEKRLQAYTGAIGADNLLYYGLKTSKSLEIKLNFGQNGYEMRLIPSSSNTLIFADEKIWYHQSRFPKPLRIPIGSGNRETNLFEESQRHGSLVIADYVISYLRSWKIYHFHDTSRSSPMKQAQNIFDNGRLQADASNIAAYLYLLQEKYIEHYERIVRHIRRVAPFFDDFILRPNPLNEETILLQWRDINSDKVFNANALSDGTLRFICLATLLNQPDDMLPSVILIDEPELGLHPFAITLLESMLRTASTKTQVIISTQSVPLINQFKPEDIIVVDRKDKQSSFSRLIETELSEWMTEYSGYGIGDLWEKNIIGGRPQRELAK
jgi:predicted ATPase